MKNNKLLAVILTAALLLGGCGGSAGEEQVVTRLEDGTRTIGYYVGGEILQNIPDMQTNGFFGAVTECNDSCHMATYQSTTKEEYDAYVKLLEKEGYVLQAGGGDYGIHNQVFYTALKKEETTIHLVYQERLKCTSVIVGDKEELSPHLQPSAASTEGFRDDLKNTLTLVDQATGQALGIIFQLRNGHFILIDGGRVENTDNVFKHLKEMTPEGEKPVIEGWFLSHSHGDHYGVMEGFADREELYSQVIIDGIYFNQPNAEHVAKTNSSPGGFTALRLLALMSKDQNGETTKVYRTVMGQRYYFADVVMDMINSTEFVPYANSDGDFNETDTVYMINVEGQKVLINGDSEEGCKQNMMESFSRDYFTVDIYQVTHHGYSSLRSFFYYMQYIKTAINPNRILVDSIHDRGATLLLRDELCEEYYYQNVGTLRMTFPYEVGNMEILGDDFETYPTWQQIMVPSVTYLYIEG